MGDAIKRLFSSRKWIMGIVGVIGYVLAYITDDPAWAATMDNVGTLLMTLIGAQGIVDTAKAVKGTSTS